MLDKGCKLVNLITRISPRSYAVETMIKEFFNIFNFFLLPFELFCLLFVHSIFQFSPPPTNSFTLFICNTSSFSQQSTSPMKSLGKLKQVNGERERETWTRKLRLHNIDRHFRLSTQNEFHCSMVVLLLQLGFPQFITINCLLSVVNEKQQRQAISAFEWVEKRKNEKRLLYRLNKFLMKESTCEGFLYRHFAPSLSPVLPFCWIYILLLWEVFFFLSLLHLATCCADAWKWNQCGGCRSLVENFKFFDTKWIWFEKYFYFIIF